MSGAATPEPPPTGGTGPSIHHLVMADLYERKQFGLRKYKTLLRANNGRDALMDAYQESLDMAVYLRQAIAERERQVDSDGMEPYVPPRAKRRWHL